MFTPPELKELESRPDHAHAQQPPAPRATNLTIIHHIRMNVTAQQTEMAEKP